MSSVAVFSPAKINLFLAVTGRRPDGYHEIVSLVAPLDIGDTIRLHTGERAGEISLVCNDPAVPSGVDNLAVRAAEAFRRAARVDRAIDIVLEKRLPMGAGLGGGSSNATAVLRGLNELFGHPLSRDTLHALAAALGSDCPLFFMDGPCLVRGRGEHIEPLSAAAQTRLTGRRVFVFKPDFGISTAWAYAQLAVAAPASYLAPREAEARLARWLDGDEDLGGLLFNSFVPVVFRKFIALDVLCERLRACPAVEGVLLSGSGSACFALAHDGHASETIESVVAEALGESAWVCPAQLA